MDDLINVDELSGVWAYLKSIDWTDPWLMVLLICHSIVTVTTILTRNNGNFQAVLFFALLMLVYFSESINEVAAQNWHYFSRQQYFDSRGMFMSLVFSIPLLMNCLIMVCNCLYLSAMLMVKLKRAQLRERIRNIQSETNAANKTKND